VPTIVFLNAQGNERTDLRLVDFLPPEQFLNRMADFKKKVNETANAQTLIKEIDHAQSPLFFSTNPMASPESISNR
jgi:hypothetical protein